MKLAQKLKFIPENPGEETKMPATRMVERPTMTAGQINSLIGAIEAPHDLCLMCIGLFCATRTSETFGLQWKSYLGNRFVPIRHRRRLCSRLSDGTNARARRCRDGRRTSSNGESTRSQIG